MPEVVDSKRRLEAIFGEGSASHDLRRRVTYERPQRGTPRSSVVARESSHGLERGEVKRHCFYFTFAAPGLRQQPLHGLAAFFHAATSDDYVPVVGFGERSCALEAQAGISAR